MLTAVSFVRPIGTVLVVVTNLRFEYAISIGAGCLIRATSHQGQWWRGFSYHDKIR